MRQMLASTIAASLAAAGLLAIAGTTPATAAAPQYPWCQRTAETGFTPSCTFTSFAQCMATVRGIGGDCIESPYLAYGQVQQRPRKGRRHHPQDMHSAPDDGWNNNWDRRW